MNESEYNKDLFKFINSSPTPFHLVSFMVKKLIKNSFIHLKEYDKWEIEKGKKYFVTRNGSSIIAFKMGLKSPWNTGIKMAGAHTDSPCLKLKPYPELESDSMTRLGVEVYGGALLTTWFDRKLNLAGKVTCLKEQIDAKRPLSNFLINYNRPVAVIPSLAIHLDRDANKNKSVNPQIHIPPLFMMDNNLNKKSFNQILLEQIKRQHPNALIKEVLGFDLSLSDIDPPCFTGLNNEFISSPRLDNLISCHACLKSLINNDNNSTSFIVCTDNEEIGSDTIVGAKGTFIKSILSRLSVTPENIARTADKSLMISLDNAHGIHPSYREKYDTNHLSELNHGPVLKINASGKYASDSETSGLFKILCKKADIPFQTFVMRSDMPCGSTIGPAISSKTGIKTVDIGAPTLAMHSIRELTGNKDPFMIFKVINKFFSLGDQLLLSLT